MKAENGLRFAVLGSGSAGNVTVVESQSSRILIDAGLSTRETARRLAARGLNLGQIDAVLISHEHDDHCRGLPVLTRRFPVQVLATRGTLRAIHHRLAPGTDVVELSAESELAAGDLRVTAFPLPHDARQPVGFRVESGGAQLGHVTDLGAVTAAVRAHLAPVHALVVESNHDLDMLRHGPYPERLKRRVLSPTGHLSNDALAELLRDGPFERLAQVVLAHLSTTNNHPRLALAVAALALQSRGSQARLSTAAESHPTEWHSIARTTAPRPAPGRSPRQLSIPFEATSSRR